MFTLKNYQQETLTVLQAYLEAARIAGPAVAYSATMQTNIGPNFKPYQTLNGLDDVPYICLRLPTGGGKTLLAAHSVAIAAYAYLEQDYPLVLWLVPTNTIRLQTLETLKTPEHPNRQVLEDAFGGRLLVLDITDYAQIRPQDLRDKAIIVVGTLATLRVDNTEGRKVYAHNENLEPHFSRVPEDTPGLERLEDGPNKGKIKYSFRNLLALSRPLVLVDEAHNASTSLSFEVMQRVNPACVVEFTATPANNSNILHNVSAAELKAEEMIKLPIILTEHQSWQAALRDSILTRQKLQELARQEPDFIRPIVLIQAESKDKEVTVEVVERYLVEQEKINRERVAIATGNQRELDGVNLLDPANKVEFVITVQALKEGWDCPFAYVFCSVATVRSAKAVEQLLGRVLRMPYAKQRRQPDLNKAYAHVSSASWPQAVGKLHDHLVSMGFDQQEAGQFIQPQPPLPGLKQVDTPPTIKLTLSDTPDLSDLNMFEEQQVSVTQTETGTVELEITGPISPELEKKLVKAAPRQDRADVEKTLTVHRQRQRPLSPAEKGETFTIPQLCLWVDGELELAEQEFFLDANGWNLLYYPAQLSEIEFTIKEETTSYSIDIQGQRLVEKFLGSQLALDLNDVQTEWTELQLSRWLDARLRQPDVKQEVMLEFCRRTVNYLIKGRKISLVPLVRTRYPLEKILRQKIKAYREQAYQDGYQETLFGPTAAVETSYEYGFNFDPNNYPAHWHYDGSYQFSPKHYYPLVGELDSRGEEFECAQAIDRNSYVKYWVRNLAKQADYSFKLPTATGYFYPDFVALLKDNRILVVEYKGSHIEEKTSEIEKQNIGELWEEKSNGRGLFLMAVKQDKWGWDVYQQLEHKITGP